MLSRSDSLHRQVQLPLSLSSRSGTPGVRSEALPAALFALAAKRSPKSKIPSRLLRVSLRNSGPVGDVS